MPSTFLITGGTPLSGRVRAGGSKNAALPLIAASLLTDEITILENVPHLSDIETMRSILDFLGAKTEFTAKGKLTINPKGLKNKTIPHEKVSRLRGAIVLMGPLLARFGSVTMAFPGGCVIGKRPIESHLRVFEALGATTTIEGELITVSTQNLIGKKFVMTEASVTATENALMAAVRAKGQTEIRFCAAEPHVSDLCNMLNKMGAKISGIGTHNLIIDGVTSLCGVLHQVVSDYLEVGTLALAAAVTQGHIIIENAKEEDLETFWEKMSEAGVTFEHRANEVEIFPSQKLKAVAIRTSIFPSFPTDLQAPFGVLLTQCEGVSRIFETMFEGRLNYIFELEKMGAKVEYMNRHQALIIGPTKLKGTPIASLDIRAGAAMVLAGLAAEGTTEISNINYIDRGYDRLEEKLSSLGAKIERIEKRK